MGAYGSSVPADREAVLSRVRVPALIMVILAALGILTYLGMLVIYIVGAGASLAEFAGSQRSEDAVAAVLGGGLGVVFGIFGVIVNGLIIWGGLKMYNGTSYVLAWVATGLSLASCASACCCLTLPVGIWGVIVLIDEEVRAAFA